MLTRGEVSRVYGFAPERVVTPGYIRAAQVNNVVTTWPVARPVAGYTANSALLTGGTRVENTLMRGGAQPMQMTQPNLAMDPSDPTTWQRQYTFSK